MNESEVNVFNFKGEKSVIKVLPHETLIRKSKELDIENIIKRCWYKFIDWVYKNRAFSKVLAYLNPQTGSVRIIDSSSIEKTDNDIFIEVYSIDYSEFKNIKGRSLLESIFYIDKFLNKKKEIGYIEECRNKLFGGVNYFFKFNK